MKKFSFDIHYDMVIQDVEVVAETLEEARQIAYDMAARLPMESMECVGKDACLSDSQELTERETRQMENKKITEYLKSWFSSYTDPTDKDEKRVLFNVAFGKDTPYWLADINQDTPPQWERDMLHQLNDGTHPRQAAIERYTRLYGLREIERRYSYGCTAKSLFGINVISR